MKLILGFSHQIPTSIQREDLLDKASIKDLYLPIKLLDLFSTFSSIKYTIYINPIFMSFLDKKFNDFASKINTLLNEKKLELLSGGYSDPIFSFISKDDKQNQMLFGARTINHIFGYNPSGIWLTDNIWDQHLPIDLFKTKFDYTFLSENTLRTSGVKESLDGYFITEEDARKVSIFPINISLNNYIENYSPEEALNKILELYKNQNLVTAFLKIDLIKPNSIDWLKVFFQLLESSSDKITSILPNEYFHLHKPAGKIYISNNDSINYKQILISNPEVNILHKKMIRVSKKINAAKEGKSRFKVIKTMIGQAQELLLRGQSIQSYSNDYISHPDILLIREAGLNCLIKAENLIDISSRQMSKWVQVSEGDFDCDNNDEIILETETQNIYISPSNGGAILELDYRHKNTNVLAFPSNNLFSFIESINEDDNFRQDNSSYVVEKIKAKEDNCKVSLFKEVSFLNSALEFRKKYFIKSGDSLLDLEYEITNKSNEIIDFYLNLSVDLNLRNQTNLKHTNINNFSIYDENNKLGIVYESKIPMNINQSNSKITFSWKICLNPQSTEVLSLKQEIVSGFFMKEEIKQDVHSSREI